jgi:hypothetical protein
MVQPHLAIPKLVLLFAVLDLLEVRGPFPSRFSHFLEHRLRTVAFNVRF